MTDRNEMNENNELNEQELEQTAGGFALESHRDVRDRFEEDYVLYRCPKCHATKKATGFFKDHATACAKCRVIMVKA